MSTIVVGALTQYTIITDIGLCPLNRVSNFLSVQQGLYLECRMFTTVLDLKPNECGEYEVAKGVSAPMFRAILVS